ncbi:cell division protein SepF [Nakamurella sp.]|uniref:cell division protein SepF n=1 Tax=Nakamurella sp. TaxID=1869182 RepID=UPI003B3A8BC7
MGSWRKVGAFLGLMPEDGRRDEYGEEYPDGQYHDGAYPEGYEHDREPEYDDRYDHGRQSPYQTAPRSVPAYEPPVTQGALAVQARPEARRDYAESTGAIRPVTVKLTGFSEARIIGEKFREGKPVILDMTEMDDTGARRLVDFAAGLAFALRGSIDKVTTKVFMLLPPDTEMPELTDYEPEYAGYAGTRPAYAGGRTGR